MMHVGDEMVSSKKHEVVNSDKISNNFPDNVENSDVYISFTIPKITEVNMERKPGQITERKEVNNLFVRHIF